MRRKAPKGEAPSVRATTSAFSSTRRKAAMAAWMKNGAETNASASTTAGVEKASARPWRSRKAPNSPRRPKASRRPTPATAGGITAGGCAPASSKGEARPGGRPPRPAKGGPQTAPRRRRPGGGPAGAARGARGAGAGGGGGIEDGRGGRARFGLGGGLPHVQLARDHAALEVEIRGGEDARRVRADGHLLRAQHDAAGLGQIREDAQAGGVVERHHQDRLVAREHRGLQHQLANQRHLLLVGAGEDVGRGAVLQLHAQLLRARELQRDVHPGVLRLELLPDRRKRLPQRRRREDGQLLGAGAERQQRQREDDAADEGPRPEARGPSHARTSASTSPHWRVWEAATAPRARRNA